MPKGSIIRPIGTGLIAGIGAPFVLEVSGAADSLDTSGSTVSEVIAESAVASVALLGAAPTNPVQEETVLEQALSVATAVPDTVPAAPPPMLGDLDNNLPDIGVGWSLVTEQDFSDVGYPAAGTWQDPVTGAYWGIAQNRDGEYPTIVADATAPSGNGLVFRQNYAGVRDGFGPHFPTCSLGNGLEFFMGFYVKFLSTWTNPLTSGIKWHIPYATLNGTNQTTGWLGLGRSTDLTINQVEPSHGWVFDGTCPAFNSTCGIPESDNPNVVRFKTEPEPPSAGLMTRGVWHKVQYYLNKNPGIVRMWINDVMVINRTGFVWSDPTGVFNSMQLGATWGGAATPNPAPEGNIIYYDKFVVYRR